MDVVLLQTAATVREVGEAMTAQVVSLKIDISQVSTCTNKGQVTILTLLFQRKQPLQWNWTITKHTAIRD